LLYHVKTILRDRFIFTNFASVAADSPIHGRHSGTKFTSVHPFVHKLQLF